MYNDMYWHWAVVVVWRLVMLMMVALAALDIVVRQQGEAHSFPERIAVHVSLTRSVESVVNNIPNQHISDYFCDLQHCVCAVRSYWSLKNQVLKDQDMVVLDSYSQVKRLRLYCPLFLFGVFSVAVSQQLICDSRQPELYGEKTNGDGGFQLTITGAKTSNEFYVPNEVYTVRINGTRNPHRTLKFIEFLLVVESEKQAMMGHTGLVTTGIFHILDDHQSRFSDICPDGVTNVNLKPKTHVTFQWTAPSVLVSSCVTFKVTLVERPRVWYMDDGALSKTLCPESYISTSTTTTTTEPTTRRIEIPPETVPTTQPSILPPGSKGSLERVRNLINNQKHQVNSSPITGQEIASRRTAQRQIPTVEKCCACDEAKYEVTFEGLWSKDSHPKDFPANEWLLHFSDIIGASHSPNYYFWREGQEPSEGIRQVAEWGATRHLENELKAQSRQINTIIKARGLWHPNEQGRTSAAFRVDRNRHLVSLVSMIGPSPDWIVGLSGLELCQEDCTWLENTQLDLYPYDAGTDTGITYMSPNSPTNPHDKIKRITETDPADIRSPFYGTGSEMKPFATVQVRRQRIYPKDCNNETDAALDAHHEVIVSENTEEINRPECNVTEWTSWSDCSVQCGKGLRMRKRSYVMAMKASMMGCDRQLVEKEMCLGRVETCDSGEEEMEEIDSICAVTQWGEWTPCSASCGDGTRTRTRTYKHHGARKKCHLDLSQSETCVGACDSLISEPTIDEEDCPMVPWSEWSPCNVTCGHGFRQRSRFPNLPDGGTLPVKCSQIPVHQATSCIGEYGPDCEINVETAKEICMLPADSGPCHAHKLRFFFNPDKNMCVPFGYGGCKGNRNRFDTEDECLKTCGPFVQDVVESGSVTTSLIPSIQERFLPPIPTTTTMRTTTARTSIYKTAPLSTTALPDDELDSGPQNLQLTSKKQPESRRVSEGSEKSPDKIDCIVSAWSDWSHCSVSCGTGFMTRTRTVLIEPKNNGRRCPRLRKRKLCKVDC